ncbi:MAG TPA: hypothetical protein VF316_05850, partial [Polyangiaceae bacterium]
AGLKVGKSDRSRAALARALARVLADDAMGKRAAELGKALAAERDGAEVAAELIEARLARCARHDS